MYSHVFLEECVFSHIGCFYLSRFDEISEAVFEAGRSLTKKAEQERKCLQNVYAAMLRVLSCDTKWRERERERELSLEVKM